MSMLRWKSEHSKKIEFRNEDIRKGLRATNIEHKGKSLMLVGKYTI